MSDITIAKYRYEVGERLKKKPNTVVKKSKKNDGRK